MEGTYLPHGSTFRDS